MMTPQASLLHLLQTPPQKQTHHLLRLKQIHGRIVRCHLHSSNHLLSHLVLSSPDPFYSLRLLFHFPNPNLLLFNAVLKSLSKSPEASSRCLRVFRTMRERGVVPDRFTFAPLLKACSNLADLSLGRCVHANVIAAGLDFHSSIGIGLVELYAGRGRMGDAHQIFDNTPHKDVILWNLMIRGFCRCKANDVGSAYRLFRKMTERNVVTWNTMIAGLAHVSRDSDALEFYREMWEAGFKPDDATLVTILPVCARLGALHIGRWIHSYADTTQLFKKFVNVGNALIDMYCKCGDLESATSVFSKMPKKNVVSWNAMISGLAFNGKGRTGINMFEEMRKQGFVPNGVTYIGVLGCCTHAGLVQKGWDFFNLMVKENRIEAGINHYGCMVDLLGRSGHITEALALIRDMPMKPNPAIWGALLSASKTYSNLKVAEVAAQELIHLEPWNSGNYVLLSNAYSEFEQWDEVENVRLMMKQNYVAKQFGRSWKKS